MIDSSAARVLRFVRLLRAAGLPLGPDRGVDAVRALSLTGVARRDDVFNTLAASLLSRHDQFELFRQAFDLFWRAETPRVVAHARALTPSAGAGDEADIPRRLREALGNTVAATATQTAAPEVVLTFSAAERLRGMDFDDMSTHELAQAKRLISTLRWPVAPLPARRFQASERIAQFDLRASVRQALRGAGVRPRYRRRRLRRPPLVAICDISGSMARYARVLLHFMHSLSNQGERVGCFVFGTRLTNITRLLRQRDPDVALRAVAEAVQDWSGGTRIGECLGEFNRLWSRRVLAQNATVLLISDGLDRSAGAGLAIAMERLHKSCHRLIWLNPLLRFDGFQPRAAGIRSMLPHVDQFLPIHNLTSLLQLGALLGEHAPVRWR